MNLRKTRVPKNIVKSIPFMMMEASNTTGQRLFRANNISISISYYKTTGSFQIVTSVFDDIFRGRKLDNLKVYVPSWDKYISLNQQDIIVGCFEDGLCTIRFRIE